MTSKKKGGKKAEALDEGLDLDTRYKTLFETSQDAIMLLDRDRFFDCNPATLKMFDLTKEIFIKLHPSEISPPLQANGGDSRAEADKRIGEAFEKGTNRFEWIHRRGTGEDFPVVVWLTAFPLEGKTVLQATVREITPMAESFMDLEAHRLKLQMLLDDRTAEARSESEDRRKAESEVRRLIKAVETSFNAVVLLDMDMNISYANNTFCRMAGVPSNQDMNMNAADFLPKESLAPITESMVRAIDGEEIGVLEIIVKNKLGKELWIEIASSVLFNENGEPDGILAIINDITDRKMFIDTLRESEEKFKMLVERSLDGILIIQEGKVAYMNPALLKLSGFSNEEQLGRDFLENVAPEERKKILELYSARMRGETIPPIYETVFMAKDGTRVPIEVNAGVMDYMGKPSDFVYLRDLTQRRKAEEEVRMLKGHFEYVLGATHTGFDIIDEDFNVIYVDPVWVNALGDYSGKKCYDYFMGERRMCENCAIPSALKTGEKKISEEYLVKEKRYIEVHTIPLKTNGLKRLVAEFNIDITERKQMLKGLEESEEKFRNLAENSPSMIFINDNGRVTYANRMSEEVMGYTREEFYSPEFDLMNIIHPEHHEQIRENLRRHFKGEDVPQYEYKLVTKDGRLLDAIINTKIIEYGGRQAILGIVTDITRKVETEKALRESYEKVRTLFSSMEDLIFGFDEDGKFLSCHTPPSGKLYIPPESFIGKLYSEVMPPHVIKLLDRAFKKNRKQETADFEYPLKVGEEESWFSAKVSPIFIDDIFNGSVAVVRDITERRMMEEALKSSREQLNALFQASMNGIGVELDGKLFFVNPSFLSMFGYGKPEEIIGLPLTTIVAPADRKRVKGYSKQRLSDEAPPRYEFKGIRKDGTSFDVEASISVYRIEEQTYYVGFVQDVTERKAIERTLLMSEQVYRSLYESTMALGELKDIDRIMEVIAEQARNMLDGECSTIYLWDEKRELLVPCFSNARQEKDKFMSFEMPLGTGVTGFAAQAREGAYSNYNDDRPKAKKGYVPGTRTDDDHLQSVIAEPLLSGNRLLGAINVIGIEKEFNDEDLGKLRILAKQTVIAYLHTRSLDDLMKSEARFRNMVENIHDGLTIVEDRIVTYLNDRAVEIYGYPRKELMGMTLYDLVIPEDREQLRAIISNARKNNLKLGEIEFWIQAKDGSRRYVRIRMSSSRDGDSTSEFIITTDITARKLAEEENKRKMMKFLLEDGRMYLVNEFRPEMSMEAFNDLLELDYLGLVISRTPKKELYRSIKAGFEHLWLGEKGEDTEVFGQILSAVGGTSGKSAVLLDRLDYLVFKYGFKETMEFIFKLRDIIYLKEQVVILSMDPSTMSEENLAIMQKEMSQVELRQLPRPPEDLMEIAQLIYERNSNGVKPSYSEIGEDLKLSKPTFRKRVRRLIAAGYAVELTKGNRKVLELTQKGRSLFFK